MFRYYLFTILLATTMIQKMHAAWDGKQYNQASDKQFGTGVVIINQCFKVNPDATVGDYGSGSGRLTLHLAQNIVPQGQVFGIDSSRSMIEEARDQARQNNIQNVSFDVQDVKNTTFEANTFDGIYSNFCLHWVKTKEDMRQVIQGIAKTLKPGGLFVAIFNLRDSEECPVPVHRIVGQLINSDEWSSYYPENEADVLGNALAISDYNELIQEAGLEGKVIVKESPKQETSGQALMQGLFALPFGSCIPENCRDHFSAVVLEKFAELGVKNESGTFTFSLNCGLLIARKPN